MTGPAAKVDEFVPHPVKDQFLGVDYCANSNPSWRTYNSSPSVTHVVMFLYVLDPFYLFFMYGVARKGGC